MSIAELENIFYVDRDLSKALITRIQRNDS